MKRKHTEVGWKKNVDKLLFILASVYLISTIGWIWKDQQQAYATRRNNNNNDSASEVSSGDDNTNFSENRANSSSSIATSENKPPTLANQLIPSTSSLPVEQNTQLPQLSNSHSRQPETEEIISFSGNNIQPSISTLPVPPLYQPFLHHHHRQYLNHLRILLYL